MLTSATRPFTADDGTGKSSRNGLDQLDKDLKVNHGQNQDNSCPAKVNEINFLSHF